MGNRNKAPGARVRRRSISRATRIDRPAIPVLVRVEEKIGAIQEVGARVLDNNQTLNGLANRLATLTQRLQGPRVDDGNGDGDPSPMPSADVARLNAAVTGSVQLTTLIGELVSRLEEL